LTGYEKSGRFGRFGPAAKLRAFRFRARDWRENARANPGRPLVPCYRQVPLEHFLIGGAATHRAKAQRACRKGRIFKNTARDFTKFSPVRE